MGWKSDILKNLCLIGDGNHSSKYPKKSEMVECGVPFIRGTNIVDGELSDIDVLYISEEKHAALKKGHLKVRDVLFTNRGEIGKVAIVDERFDGANLNSQIAWLRCGEHLTPQYLYYFMQSNAMRNHFNKEKSGAALQQFPIKMLNVVKVNYPPIPEQKRIVAILDQVFADIEQARAKTEQNLKNARELFESYLQQVFSQRGEGWVESKMSDICEGKITDGTHQTPKYFDSGHIFLSSRNVTTGLIDWDNVKYLDEAQHLQMQKRLSPQINDILLAKNGTTGVAAIVDRDVSFDIYVSLALLRPSKNILPRYLLHFVNSPVAKYQFNKRLKGVGVPNLHLKEIKDVTVSLPVSIDQQDKIVRRLDALLEERRKLEDIYSQKLKAIDNLKKSILQKAFSGELTKTLEGGANKGAVA